MRRVRQVILVLAALAASSTRTEAQLSYTVQSVSQLPSATGPNSYGGFLATFLFRNINNYGDPQIISFRDFAVHTSQRVRDFCDTYGLSYFDCSISGVPGSFGTQGSVQTGTIPVGSSEWLYVPGLSEDSCNGYCFSRAFTLGGGGFGLLGCQAPFPTPDFYSGRTCDIDGYTGSLRLTTQFTYYAWNQSVPTFTFDESDVSMTATNLYWDGPSGFVHATPEPSSWILMATGLVAIGSAARRRRKAA